MLEKHGEALEYGEESEAMSSKINSLRLTWIVPQIPLPNLARGRSDCRMCFLSVLTILKPGNVRTELISALRCTIV